MSCAISTTVDAIVRCGAMAHGLKTLASRYDLLEVIGRGGMGVVYRGRDRVLHRTVAVKLLPERHTTDAALVARFAREARAAAALNHPNVVAVFDTGTDGQTHFIVMEHVSGRTLAQRLRDEGRLPVDETIAIGHAIAVALAAAHRRGIIHRDIKPGNVIISNVGEVKVLDFGIARPPGGEALTQPEGIVGSACYMAPEIIEGRSAGASSDIYALGCVLYEMLTGRPPFSATGITGVLSQHQSSAPSPPRQVSRRVPRKLDALVMAMLAKEPHERPGSAIESAQRLSELLRHRAAPSQGAVLPGIDQRTSTLGKSSRAASAGGSRAARSRRRGSTAHTGSRGGAAHARSRGGSLWTRRAAAMVALASTLALVGVVAARGHSQPAPAEVSLSPGGAASAGVSNVDMGAKLAGGAGGDGVIALIDSARTSFARVGALIDPALAAESRVPATRVSHATASINGQHAMPASYDSVARSVDRSTVNIGGQEAPRGSVPGSSRSAIGEGGASPPGHAGPGASSSAPGHHGPPPGGGPPHGAGPPAAPAGAPPGRVASGGGGRNPGRGPGGAGPPGLDVRAGR